MDIVKAVDWKQLAGETHAEDMATFVQALFDCADLQGGLEKSDADLLRAQVMEHWQLLTENQGISASKLQGRADAGEDDLAKSRAEASLAQAESSGKRVGDPRVPVEEHVGEVGAKDGKASGKPSPQPELVQLGPEVFRTSSKLLKELADLFENAWARPGADFQPEVVSICETWKQKLLKLHAGALGLETWIDAVLHSVNSAVELEAGTAEGTWRGDVDTGRLQTKLQEAVQKHLPAALKAAPKERSTSSRQPARLREKRNRALLTAGDLLTQEK